MKNDMVVNQINAYIDDYTKDVRRELNATKSIHDKNGEDRYDTSNRMRSIFSKFLSEKTDNGIIKVNTDDVINLEVRLSLGIVFVINVFYTIEKDILPNEIIVKVKTDGL